MNDTCQHFLATRITQNATSFLLTSGISDGDLDTFNKEDISEELLENTTVQLYLSLIFFYQKTSNFYMNCKLTNFMYFKIKAGGYFHYNIFGDNYYLKNMGYLWVINTDLNEIKPFKNAKVIKTNTDFNQIQTILNINYLIILMIIYYMN